jgi:hypothetical protein
MKFDKSDKLLADTLQVIAKYDAALYARMMADDWTVTFRFDDLPADTVAMFRELQKAELYGTTAPKLCMGDMRAREALGPAARVTLGAAAIEQRAGILNVPPAMFAASILAHEYTHINQAQCSGDPFRMEPAAYDAGTELARRLPAPYGERIAEFSEENKEQNIIFALLGEF